MILRFGGQILDVQWPASGGGADALHGLRHWLDLQFQPGQIIRRGLGVGSNRHGQSGKAHFSRAQPDSQPGAGCHKTIFLFGLIALWQDGLQQHIYVNKPNGERVKLGDALAG